MSKTIKSLFMLLLFVATAFATTPKVGDKAPQFDLPSATGETVALQGYAGKSKVVLVFYRGDWCPFCRKQLSSFAANYDKYKAAGTEVIAISVDSPEKNKKLSEKLNLTFPVLSDSGHKIIDAYSILDPGGKISRAAVFILDKKGVVRWLQVSDDYKVRPMDEVLLNELAKIQ
jgi:thioredoxin-dependent peroxiredoxin